MKRFKRHLCDHLFLRTGGYLDRHGDKPGLARTGVRSRCIMRIRTWRDGEYLFFCKILIFQVFFNGSRMYRPRRPDLGRNSSLFEGCPTTKQRRVGTANSMEREF